MARNLIHSIAWFAACAALPAMATDKPANRAARCHASEQLVRVKAFDDRGSSVHDELVELPSGRALEPIDVAKPGHAYYQRRFRGRG